MAQVQAQQLRPADHVILALLKVRATAALAKFYVRRLPSRPSEEVFRSSVSEQSSNVTTETPSGNGHAGYQDLPPELRLQILEEALVFGKICPYQGLTPYQRWESDWQILTAAQKQAWKKFIRRPSSLHLCGIKVTSDCYFTIIIDKALRSSATETVPHFLRTCRTGCNEGGEVYYSKNTFCVAYGPLSNSKGYYDGLQPKHQRLIRHMVVILHASDLTIEAFNHIEDQLRAKDIVSGRLPPDDSVDEWLPAVVYHLTWIWRSKLAWLRQWTWLEHLEIYMGFPTENSPHTDVPPGMRVKVPGQQLPTFLKGIGPIELHCPVMDCYKECDSILAGRMRTQEHFMWTMFAWLIECFGWKATKALIRGKAYKVAAGRWSDYVT